MSSYYTLFSTLFPVGTADNVAPALALYQQFADELEEQGETVGFLAEAGNPHNGAHLWLCSDESGDVEHVIAFALRVAEALDLQGMWGFHWALTCSGPKLDGFGGGAQVIDLGARCSVSWVDAKDWMEVQIACASKFRVLRGTAPDRTGDDSSQQPLETQPSANSQGQE